MDGAELVGMAAGFLTTIGFLPQAVRAWRTRQVGDLSLGMYCALLAGMALWFVYGCLIGSTPVIAYNVASFALAASILAAKLRFG